MLHTRLWRMVCFLVVLLSPTPSSIGAADRSVAAISDSFALSGDGREELPSVDEGGCRLWAVSCGAVWQLMGCKDALWFGVCGYLK